MGVSTYLLCLGVKSLPVGTAYAVWTGIGAVATASAGILFLHETASVLRIACIFLIVVGVIGLVLSEH